MNYLINSSTDPYFNMAFDEYCLEQYPSNAPFFYLWRNSPAVIIGLNQNAYSEVNLDYLEKNGITLARRMTGGGAVYHDLQNMNYTIIGPKVTPEPFVEALRALGVPAELTGRNDIFVEGRKVSGYARRVFKDREIVHGTMMYNVDIDTLTRVLDVPGSKMDAKGVASVKSRVANLKDYLPQFRSLDELQAKLQELLAGNDVQLEFGEARMDQVRRIAGEKFSTWDWVYGHSRETDLNHKAKLACGTVEVHLGLDKGLIEHIRFAGDFLGDCPAEELASALKGIRYERRAVLEVLEERECGLYFSRTEAEELASLILGAI